MQKEHMPSTLAEHMHLTHEQKKTLGSASTQCAPSTLGAALRTLLSSHKALGLTNDILKMLSHFANFDQV